MRHTLRAALGMAVMVAALSPRASASDEDGASNLRKRITDLENENASLQSKCWWLGRMRGHEPRLASSGTSVVRLGGRGSDPQEEKLREIRLPDAPTKDDVREYVVRIIIAAQDRGVFGPDDPEIGMLKRVGSGNVDVLIEPLVHLGGFNGSSYVVAALKAVVGERHKATILAFLPYSLDLLGVVVAHGWTKDAAPLLLKRLAERSPYLWQSWIDAAATVAGPENYEDLKFQLAHGDGTNPWWTWLAIRGLPGMEPLDGFVAEEWRRAARSANSLGGRSFAAVAAHYGQVDALGVLAKNVKDKYDWRQPFRDLTGFQGPIEDASAWWDRNKDELTFDGAKRVYVRSSPPGK